jgi:hypothetical protein
MSTNKFEEAEDFPSLSTPATRGFRSGSLKQQQNASSIHENARAKNEMIEYLVN